MNTAVMRTSGIYIFNKNLKCIAYVITSCNILKKTNYLGVCILESTSRSTTTKSRF